MHKLEDPENISWGQKYLLDLIQKRALAAFVRSELEPNYHFTYLFHISINQIKIPPIKLINMLRHVISPGDWFYPASGPRPYKRHLEKKDFDIKDSINYTRLYSMFSSRILYAWCKKNNLDYNIFNHVFNGHWALSPKKIKKLEPWFDPALWFIDSSEI